MAAVLRSELRAVMIDGVSAVAKKISASLFGIGRSAASVKGGGFGSAIAASAERASRNVVALQAKLVAATAGAYALSRAMQGMVNPAAKFETVLLDIGQKADLSDAAVAQLGTRIRAIAKDVGRGAGDIAKGMDTLLGFGLDTDSSASIISPIARAATAYNATVEDLSKAAFSSIDNLKVPIAEIGRALDAMSYSGKSGAFEIKDMAAEFPSLTASAQALGMKGVDAVAKLTAALQIARKGAATGSEAATNTANLMAKVISPETTKKFAKVGINIRKELKKTQKEGGDVFEMIAHLVTKATKGDLSKLGDFFQDEQVAKFLRPLIANLDEYRRIRDGANKAVGVVAADFARRAKTFESTLARFRGAAEDLAISIGNRVLPTLTEMAGTFANLLNTLDGRVTVFDKIGKALAGFMNGLGLTDGSTFAQALTSLRDLLFGTVEAFEGDTDRLAQIFKRFQEFGAGLRGFADAVTSCVSAVASFAGVDTDSLLSFLGTLAGYGAGLALTATALGLVAKSVMSVGKAMLFLSGIKTAGSIVKWLAGATAGGGAAAGGAAAGAAGGGMLGWLLGLRKWAGPIGVGIAGKAAIDTASDVRKRIGQGTAKHGLHSPAGDDGDAKLAEYKAEIAEIEGTLDRLREKSHDPESFAVANQAQIRRLDELKIASQNLSEELAKRQSSSSTDMPPRFWSPKPADPVPTIAPLPPSRPPDLGALNAAKDKAAETAAQLDELNATLSPRINMAEVKALDTALDGILAKYARVGEVARAVRATASSTAIGGSSSPGRGRSDVAVATANLSRSRETNMQDRPIYG